MILDLLIGLAVTGGSALAAALLMVCWYEREVNQRRVMARDIMLAAAAAREEGRRSDGRSASPRTPS